MVEKRKRAAEPDPGQDPLGKPVARYSSNGRALVLVATAVILGLIGGWLLGAAGPLASALLETPDGRPYAVVGWALILVALPVMAYGVFRLGDVFEIRRRGVRFAEGRRVTELSWDEVWEIEVLKEVVRYKGTRRTYWDIHIRGMPEMIYLNRRFLQQVPNVTTLVSLLRTHSGKEVQMPTDW